MMGLKDRVTVRTPRVAVVVHDLCMVWLAWTGLHQLRYAILPQSPSVEWWARAMAIVVFAQGLVFWQVGLYRGIWRFASVPDLINILKASVIGLLAIVIRLVLYQHLEQGPPPGV